MNKTARNSAAAVLLLAGAALVWTGTEANAQAGFRRGQGGFRTRATSNSTTGITTGTSGTTAAGSGTSGTMCPANGSGAASTTTTAGSTTSSATQTSAAAAAASRSAQSLASAQSSSGLSAQVGSSSQVVVQWAGNTSGVQSVTFGVFAANGRMLDSKVVTQAPARAALSLNSAASSYGMRVTYANGTSSTVYRPLR